MRLCVCVCVCACVCKYIYIHIQITHIHVCVVGCQFSSREPVTKGVLRFNMHMYIHMYVCMYIHMYICVCIYIYTYICTRMNRWERHGMPSSEQRARHTKSAEPNARAYTCPSFRKSWPSSATQLVSILISSIYVEFRKILVCYQCLFCFA